MILLDTDHLSVLLDGRHSRHSSLLARLEAVNDALAIPVVSVEEQLRAWLAQVHRLRDLRKQVLPYERLIDLLDTLNHWDIAPWTVAAAEEFVRLRGERIRIGTQDLKIASIALSTGAILLSANLRDFRQVPALRVENWIA